MSSKVKSEKTKVKFPQSNINHVYKGNTTEPQHKPALRQYGMQVVGKLQGTRRLPPPAWVPSIKAETGGLDSQVSLVPAGGGGWGAPSTSNPEQQNASPTSTNSLSTVSALPSVNGVLYSETVGISLEPAYTKLAYGNSDPGGVGVSTSSDTPVGVNGSTKTNKTQEVITKDKVPNQPLKSQNDKLGSTGGLAANKPFFQRPAPSIRSTTATSHLSEQSAQFCTPPPNTVKTNLHSVPMKPFVNPPNNLSEPCVMQSHSTVPQSMYIDGSNLITSDAWSAADISYTRNSSISHSRPPAPNMPYSMPSMNAPCVITSDTNRSLPNVQFINHTTSTPGVDPFFSTHPLQSRLAASFAGGITDSVRSTTDVDIELQQAQRQARTQEYKNAVERAQQARARQKLPENFPVESDNILSTSALGLFSGLSESRPISSVPAPFTTTVCQVGPNYLFPVGDHSSVNHMLNVPPHNLLPPTFPTSGPLDITTAIAAATAAAMAYTGGVDSVVPEKSGVEMPISIPSIISHTQMPISGSSNTVTAGGWQTPFASNNSMPAAVVRLLSQQPHMAQLLQNALNMSSGNSQMPKTTQHSQGVFVNPDFFVERFLEIFNQPQISRPQGPPVNSSKNMSSETNTQATISTLRQDQSSTNTVDSCLRSQFGSAMQVSDNPDDLVTQNVKEIDGSSEKTHRVHRISQSSNRSDAPIVTTNASITINDSSNQRTTRVPGLMDIKVSCASSQHLAHLWDKEDHLLDPGYHAYRGRGKCLTPYKPTRGGTKGRGTTKSHPMEAVIGDFRSISLREPDDPQYPSDDYDASHRSHSVSKSSKSWHSKPSRSVDDSLIDAYSTNTCVRSEFTNDEHIRYRKQIRNVQDDNCWTRTNLNNNVSSPSVLSSESGSNECGVLSDVQEADGTEDDKGYDQCLDDSGKKVGQRLGKFSHPDQINVSDNKEKNKSLSGTYNRRARRARVGTNSHFTSSRRYSKGSEQDYYWRQHYGSGTRSTRSGHSTGLSIDQRKNRSHDDILYRPSERQASRNVASGSFAGISGYFSGRMTRSYVQYESSRDQNNRELDSQHYITNGRQLRSQKMYYSHKGQFSSATDFSHEYVASDEENKSSHTRFSNHPESRAKTYSVSGRFHKAYRKNPTNTPTKSELNNQQSTGNEQVTKLTLDGTATYNQTEDIDDSEVPTVRVPASDTVTINSHYIKSRTNRYATHKVLGTSKRVSSNRASQNHQSKRPNSSVHTSRRYREMRDRYNDEKDGDGGAAAGGVGRSGASTGVSASIIFKTGTNGSSNSRGGSNQCGGGSGHTDSTAVDFVEQENVDDVSNVASESLDENNMNPRSLMRRRQTAGTSASSAGGIASHTETSTISTSPSVINGTVRKSEKSSHLSGTSSANHQSAYYGTTRTSRSGTTFYHRKNITSIPPLMSIKPHTSFTENSYVLDSFPTWDNRTERKSDAVFRDDFRGKFSQSVKEFDELNQEIFESDTPHGDGFTKVVSKASKYFARRRMQQEIAISRDFRIKKNNAFSKTLSNTTQAFTKENSSVTATFSQNYANTNDYKIQFSGLSKNLSNKKKYLPTKVSFMGPPLCIDTTHTSSVCTVTTSNLSGSTNQPVSYSSSTASPTSSVLQKISFSTTRTWSKVVGTKFMKVPPVNLGDATNTSPAVSLNSSPVWHEEHSHQINTDECTEQDKKLVNCTTATSSTSSMESSVTCSYASMQSLWSAGDNATRVNKSDLTTNGLLLASSTIHSTAVSSSGTLCTVSPSTTLSSQISNNICKVRPQQQQHVTSISPLVPTSVHLNLLSPSNNIIDNISTPDLIAETERSDFECCSDIGRSTAILRPHTSDILQNSTTLSSNSFQSWPSSNTLYTPFSLSNVPVNHHENMFSGNIWPTVDPSMDMNVNCMTGSYNPSSNQSHFQNQWNSNVFSNVLTHNNTVPSLDSITKQSNIPVTPRQQHNIPSYQSSMLTPADRINIYSNSLYANSSTELGKLSNNICVPSQQMTFVSGAPSLYVHPQSTAIQPAPSRSFHSLSLPVQSQMSQARKCRQQIPHQIDPSAFTAGYTSFPTDMKNEYNFPLSVAGCIPPPPTGGLYSAIHPHSQSNYPQNSGIHTFGFPTTVNSYSLLGNPSATSNLQGAGQPYSATIGPTAGTGGGLLPHPVPQGGYNNTPCHFPTPITSNSVSNYANASNYVGVIGGGRPNADHSNTTVRQRSLQHHSLFTHPNLPQSPSAQGQPSFQMPSSFYPSISPSHQRVSLQQYGGSSRGAVTGPNYPQNGLYGPPFGGASHPSNQATPPPIGHQLNPMGFYNNPFQYPSRPDFIDKSSIQ
ncbi:Protein PRRC2A [Schistosoma japonicum]|nr:Protein PRRC2A [Schistosoma japonicum]